MSSLLWPFLLLLPVPLLLISFAYGSPPNLCVLLSVSFCVVDIADPD